MNKAYIFRSFFFSAALFFCLVPGAYAASTGVVAETNGSAEINATEVSAQREIASVGAASSALVSAPDLNELNFADKEVLTEKEEDRIYISFMDEKRKKEEEERMAEKERKERGSNLSPVTPKNTGGVDVFPHDPNNPQVIGDKTGLDLNGIMSPPAIAPVSNFMITGISCVKKHCVAFTTEGSKKKGDTLKSGEKIKKITSSGIETTMRTISF